MFLDVGEGMRRLIPPAAVILAACAATPSGAPLEMRTVQTGGYAAAAPDQPQAILVRDEESLRRIWGQSVADGREPQIDFSTGSAVILLAGSHRTGGWSIEPQSAAMEGETLVITAAVRGPAAGSIVSQALTSPWAVVVVNTQAATDVRWTRP